MRKWLSSLRVFSVRFIICLILLCIGYALLFIALPAWLRKPSVHQEIASLRTRLNQGYLYGNSIIGFDQRDAAAYSALGDLIAQFEHNASELDKAYGDAKKHLSPKQQQQAKTIIESQQQAAANLTEQYGLFANLLRYDPANDFGNLDPKKSNQQILQKIDKAKQGLHTLAEDGRLSTKQATAIQAMANCLSEVSRGVMDKSDDAANSAKRRCTKDYPALRKVATQQIVAKSFSQSYQTYMKNYLPPLLATLDKIR